MPAVEHPWPPGHAHLGRCASKTIMETTMPRTIRRRDILAGAGAVLAVSALPGCASVGRVSGASGHGTPFGAGPASRRRGPHHPDHGLYAALSRTGPDDRGRTPGGQKCRSQLRSRRQRWSLSWGSAPRAQLAMATGDGIWASSGAARSGDVGDPCAAGRRARDDPREGTSAERAFLARHRRMDAGFADLLR